MPQLVPLDDDTTQQPVVKPPATVKLTAIEKPKIDIPKDKLSINPITNIKDSLTEAGRSLHKGVAELNPFSPARHEQDAPWYRGLLETGKSLKDIGAGAIGVAATPFTASSKELGNLYERGASAIAPGQKLFRSEDFQTALQGGLAPGIGKAGALAKITEKPPTPEFDARVAKITSSRKPAELPSKGVELPIQREPATPHPETAAALKVKFTPLDEAKSKAKAPLAAKEPIFVVENKGPSTVFPGTNKFRVKDVDGKHITTIMAKQEDGSIKIEGVGGGASGMTEKNMFGTSVMRKILPQLQEHFPTAIHIEGVRTTGISAKNVKGVGDRIAKMRLKPLKKDIDLSKMSNEEFHNYMESMSNENAIKYLKSMSTEEYKKRYPLAGRRMGIDQDPIDLTKPITAYHGTDKDFENYDVNLTRGDNPAEKGASFFSRTPEGADVYASREGGNIRKVNIDPKNHKVYDPQALLNDINTRDSFLADLKESFIKSATRNKELVDWYNTPRGKEDIEKLWEERKNKFLSDAKAGQGISFQHTTGALIARAKREGADSATIRNLMESGGADQLMVFNPERISSFWKGESLKPQSVGAAPTGYPELSASGKGGAQSLLQQRLGFGERETSKAITALEPYQAQLNAAPRSERLKVIDYIENRSHGNITINPKFKAAADEMRKVYKDIEFKLGNTTSTENMKFIEDYFRHQVKDQKQLGSFMSAWKEGSAKGATKQRVFPTVSDLLQHGHELVNDNPIEVTMDYAYHMNRFVATNEAFDIAKSQGVIKMMSPSRVPENYLLIEGRHGGLNQHGQAAYAPAEFAKPWNNFVSQGFTGTFGDIVQGTRAITNVTTAVKLMSGYHFATMGAASFTSELARAFDNLAYGRPMAGLRAGGSAASILGPVIRQFKTGLRGQKIYAGGAGSAEENKVIDYLTQANFRPSRVDRSISVTQTGNLYTAWKRGALSHQLRSQMSDIAAAPGVMKAAPIARGVWNLLGRTVDTIMAPLFEKTIPALKTGAAMESLRDFLIARPTASFEEIITEARNVQRNMDDRFGEMNHDNLFWNQKLKESLQASMLSYSWNVGIGRALGGGGKDIVEALGKKATMGKFGSAGWTRRASYALAFPIGAAYLSAVYQTLKTGQAPRGPQDLLAPRTGGTNPANKYRQESDERIAIPGHMKDVFEARDLFTGDKTPWEIAANKLNPMLRTAGDLITGTDWRGHRISDPEANTQTKIKQYLSYALQGTVEPIAVSQFEQRKEGTNINLFETILGIHPAPDFLQDPSGHGDMMRAKANNDYVKTLSALKSEALRRGDRERADAFQQDIHRRQQQMKRLQP